MKKKLWLTTILSITWLSINAQMTFEFQKAYGGTITEEGKSVQQTADGGYVITGYTQSFGAGDNDVYLLKTNSTGDILWTKTYGGQSDDEGYSVQQTNDGGYIITGETYSFGAGNSDVYLIKTDSTGDTLWTKTYGGISGEHSYSVQQTNDGGYVITGNTGSFGGLVDVYLIKTSSTGDSIWTKTYGGGIDAENGYSVQQTADGGYVITGYTFSFGAGSGDVYLIKTDNTGDTLWTKTYGGTNNDGAYAVQQTADGGYIITGYTFGFGAGDNDVYLLKTNSTGDILWTKTYGGQSDDFGYSVQQTADGGYVITGYTQSFGAGSADVYLIKTDNTGDTLWTKTYGGTNNDGAYAVQQTADGGYVIVGSSISFKAGNTEVYLITTNSNGNSGCNEYSTNTIVTTPATVVNTTATIIGSGATITNAATLVSNPTTIDSTLCSTVGIQEKNNTLNNISLYPNPFSTYATIEFKNHKKEKHTLIIYNSLGQLVRQIDNISNGQIRIERERDDLTNGLYFFQLQTNSEIVGKMKVIIE